MAPGKKAHSPKNSNINMLGFDYTNQETDPAKNYKLPPIPGISEHRLNELEHSKMKLQLFEAELELHIESVGEKAQERADLQKLRLRFMKYIHEAVRMRLEISEAKIGIFAEREKNLERNAKIMKLRAEQVQDRRRIQQLLILTAPNQDPAATRKLCQKLFIEGRLMALSLSIETLRKQLEGYNKLTIEYISGILEDTNLREVQISKDRESMITVISTLTEKLDKSKVQYQYCLEQYLLRRHNAILMKQNLDDYKATYDELRAKLERNIALMEERGEKQSSALRIAAKKELELIQSNITKTYMVKEKNLIQLQGHCSKIHDLYKMKIGSYEDDHDIEDIKVKALEKLRKYTLEIFNKSIAQNRRVLKDLHMKQMKTKLLIQNIEDIDFDALKFFGV